MVDRFVAPHEFIFMDSNGTGKKFSLSRDFVAVRRRPIPGAVKVSDGRETYSIVSTKTKIAGGPVYVDGDQLIVPTGRVNITLNAGNSIVEVQGKLQESGLKKVIRSSSSPRDFIAEREDNDIISTLNSLSRIRKIVGISIVNPAIVIAKNVSGAIHTVSKKTGNKVTD